MRLRWVQRGIRCKGRKGRERGREILSVEVKESAYAVLNYGSAPGPYDLKFTDSDFTGVN